MQHLSYYSQTKCRVSVCARARARLAGGAGGGGAGAGGRVGGALGTRRGLGWDPVVMTAAGARGVLPRRAGDKDLQARHAPRGVLDWRRLYAPGPGRVRRVRSPRPGLPSHVSSRPLGGHAAKKEGALNTNTMSVGPGGVQVHLRDSGMSAGCLGPAPAEITLKDGTVVDVKLKSDDVQSFTFPATHTAAGGAVLRCPGGPEFVRRQSKGDEARVVREGAVAARHA